jgi:hypothetical protein
MVDVVNEYDDFLERRALVAWQRARRGLRESSGQNRDGSL